MSETASMVSSIIGAVKSLTLTNVLVIFLLIIGIAPAYLAWKILNDEALRAVMFSNFRLVPIPGSNCELREASEIGDDLSWFLTHNFALNGQDRWYVGINIPTKPGSDAIAEYCEVLSNLIIYARDRSIEKPDFPHGGTTIQVAP